jgi:hypothetical protein
VSPETQVGPAAECHVVVVPVRQLEGVGGEKLPLLLTLPRFFTRASCLVRLAQAEHYK